MLDDHENILVTSLNNQNHEVPVVDIELLWSLNVFARRK